MQRLDKTSNHVMVVAVDPTSPAQKAGIQVRDVLLKINDIEISRAQQALEVVINARPGSWLKIEVLRNAKRISTRVWVEPESQAFTTSPPLSFRHNVKPVNKKLEST